MLQRFVLAGLGASIAMPVNRNIQLKEEQSCRGTGRPWRWRGQPAKFKTSVEKLVQSRVRQQRYDTRKAQERQDELAGRIQHCHPVPLQASREVVDTSLGLALSPGTDGALPRVTVVRLGVLDDPGVPEEVAPLFELPSVSEAYLTEALSLIDGG